MKWCPTLLITIALLGCQEPGAPPAPKSGSATAPASSSDGIDIIVLRYQQNSESTEQREKGFLDTLGKEFPQIRILSDEQFAGATRESAMQKAENLLTRFGDQVDGWFCPCEPVTFGTIRALRNKGLNGKVKVVGFDAGAEMITALVEEDVHGLILQDPVKMGYLGVKTAVEKLSGKDVQKVVSTGEYVVTKANMDEPANKDLHSPDLSALDAPAATAGDKKYTIAVIPKGTLHDFWKSIHAGAIKAERELGNVEILWKGPAREDNRDQQIQVVENFINRGVDAIVLAPLDKTALVSPVKQAMDKNIPVVIIDSGLDSDQIVSYVATDNYHGGVLAARHLAGLLLEKPGAKTQ